MFCCRHCCCMARLQVSIDRASGCCTADRPGVRYYILPQHRQVVMQSAMHLRQPAIASTMHIMHPPILEMMQSNMSAMQATMPSKHEMIIPIPDYGAYCNLQSGGTSDQERTRGSLQESSKCIVALHTLYIPVVDVTSSTPNDSYQINVRVHLFFTSHLSVGMRTHLFAH